jgi:hypothetical protein
MKIDFKKLKAQSWKKTLAWLIINGTLLTGVMIASAIALLIVYLTGCVLWHSYSSAPSIFHWMFGVLGFIGVWMWSFDWADKQ